MSERLPSVEDADLAQSGREQRAIIVVFAIGMFMSILDTQIVNVALATLGRDFDASTSAIQWIVTGYLLSLAVFVPTAGWLGDRFGTRRMYLVAIATFTLSSAACAIAPSLIFLVTARVIQGAGGGMLMPLGQTVLYRAFPPSERVKVARSVSRITVIAPATAPIISGILVTSLSWHWIFLINVPIGIVQFCFAFYALRPYRAPERSRFDALGAALGGGGLSALLYALSEGPDLGWDSPAVIGTGLGGISALGLFTLRELRITHPVLKLRLLLADRMLRRACVVVSFMSMSFFGCILFTQLYLQQGLGASALQSGLTTFPCAIGIGLSAQIAARLYPHFGPRKLMAFGFLGIGTMAAVLSTNGGSGDLWAIRAEMFAFGLCVPYVMVSTQASAYARVSHADTSHATSIFTSVQRSASALGVAILTTILDSSAPTGQAPNAESFRLVYFSIAALALAGIVTALRVHDSDAAATIVPPKDAGRRRLKRRPAHRASDPAASITTLGGALPVESEASSTKGDPANAEVPH